MLEEHGSADEGPDALLRPLAEGSRVAVVLLRGSLCPVTLGHVRGLVEARRILLGEPGAVRPARLERFAEVVGLIALNGDGHVAGKLSDNGEPSLRWEERRRLVDLATEEYAWIWSCEDRSQESPWHLPGRWPTLRFAHFYLNGADDVAKYEKYDCSADYRYITMGRPGFTEQVLEGARRAGVDLEEGFFVLGPELPDISATKARRALREGDRETLGALLHPRVTEWCLQNGPYRPGALAEQPAPAERWWGEAWGQQRRSLEGAPEEGGRKAACRSWDGGAWSGWQEGGGAWASEDRRTASREWPQ